MIFKLNIIALAANIPNGSRLEETVSSLIILVLFCKKLIHPDFFNVVCSIS